MHQKNAAPQRQLFGIAAAAAAAISLASPTPALARIMQRSATACVAGKNDASKINYTQFGIQNESTSASAKIWCPVLYDHDYDGNIVDVQLTAIDQNSSSGKDVSCTIYGIDEDGLTGYSPAPAATSGASASPQFLGFSDLLQPYFLNYTISCTLPQVSSSGKKSSLVVYGPVDHD